MMSTQHNYAGIDIAKRNFVIAVSSLSKTKTETNNPKASRSLHIRVRGYATHPTCESHGTSNPARRVCAERTHAVA